MHSDERLKIVQALSLGSFLPEQIWIVILDNIWEVTVLEQFWNCELLFGDM